MSQTYTIDVGGYNIYVDIFGENDIEEQIYKKLEKEGFQKDLTCLEYRDDFRYTAKINPRGVFLNNINSGVHPEITERNVDLKNLNKFVTYEMLKKAVDNENEQLIEDLLNIDINLIFKKNSPYFENIFDYAAGKELYDIIEFIFDLDLPFNKSIFVDHFPDVKRLLGLVVEYFGPNLENDKGDTLLHAACDKFDSSYCEFLLLKGATQKRGSLNETPFEYVCRWAHIEEIKIFLKYGAEFTVDKHRIYVGKERIFDPKIKKLFYEKLNKKTK